MPSRLLIVGDVAAWVQATGLSYMIPFCNRSCAQYNPSQKGKSLAIFSALWGCHLRSFTGVLQATGPEHIYKSFTSATNVPHNLPSTTDLPTQLTSYAFPPSQVILQVQVPRHSLTTVSLLNATIHRRFWFVLASPPWSPLESSPPLVLRSDDCSSCLVRPFFFVFLLLWRRSTSRRPLRQLHHENGDEVVSVAANAGHYKGL
ncbi:hypothetical protein LXA43DRAFT_165537 [Ganoderma leucocontextum]|nr:hypothetical protein LXA43DRAFT_165537 [Ganoderma leucocontextum]